jgi:hypothetical protein
MLSDSHKRAIFFAFLDIHRRIAEVEAMMARQETLPFDKHVNDLSREEMEHARQSFARLREVMQGCLRESQISIESDPTSVRWALQCCMSSIAIAISEINPARLKAYGPLDASAELRIQEIQESLRRILAEVNASNDRGGSQALDTPPSGAIEGDVDGQ